MKTAFVQKCSECSREYRPEEMVCRCPNCSGRIEILYDYDRIRENLIRKKSDRTAYFWQFSELLPVLDRTKPVSLGEGGTCLLRCKRLESRLGLRELYVKDETRNPTGSFKDRCSAITLSKASECSVTAVVMPSSGNAGASACAYSARAGVACYVFVPSTVEAAKMTQILIYGGRVVRIEGALIDCHFLVSEASKRYGWQEITTNSLSNVYSTQGSKTTAYEICVELGWETPDWILLPFGGGGNLYGHWLGFQEFLKLGFINKMPRMAAVQAAGCAPFVKAFRERITPAKAEAWMNPETVATGIACGYPYDIDVALPAIYQSNGTAETVTDKEILDAQMLLAKAEGIFAEPSAAASIAGLKKLIDNGIIDRSDLIVCEVTGNGLKDTQSAMKASKIPPVTVHSLEELDRVLQLPNQSI